MRKTNATESRKRKPAPDRRVELHAKTTVDLLLAVAIRPWHAENDDALCVARGARQTMRMFCVFFARYGIAEFSIGWRRTRRRAAAYPARTSCAALARVRGAWRAAAPWSRAPLRPLAASCESQSGSGPAAAASAEAGDGLHLPWTNSVSCPSFALMAFRMSAVLVMLWLAEFDRGWCFSGGLQSLCGCGLAARLANWSNEAQQ